MWLGWASQRSAASRHGAAAVQGSVEKKVSYELATALADTYRDVVQREFYDQLNLSMPVAVSPVRLYLGVITQSSVACYNTTYLLRPIGRGCQVRPGPTKLMPELE